MSAKPMELEVKSRLERSVWVVGMLWVLRLFSLGHGWCWVPDKCGYITEKSIFLGDLEGCVYGVGVGGQKRQRERQTEIEVHRKKSKNRARRASRTENGKMGNRGEKQTRRKWRRWPVNQDWFVDTITPITLQASIPVSCPSGRKSTSRSCTLLASSLLFAFLSVSPHMLSSDA